MRKYLTARRFRFRETRGDSRVRKGLRFASTYNGMQAADRRAGITRTPKRDHELFGRAMRLARRDEMAHQARRARALRQVAATGADSPPRPTPPRAKPTTPAPARTEATAAVEESADLDPPEGPRRGEPVLARDIMDEVFGDILDAVERAEREGRRR